ncbi:DUF11 domain-containing protein [Calothrix sp. PCC 7507]|uniref:DUF11 domain-containing protein n=1 Tax=Calothrix sp. PCC 7507 TaxID=99598 RepID=UPI00029F22A8|nr:DUF11 domain-containing protein [Calothrix sp. PCC 7507]AFY35581.1 conserved repeat domain protein [Calothrix sp. PCC 7507]
MTSTFSWSRWKSLIYTIFATSIYISTSGVSKAQTSAISNTARGGANGIAPSNSNTVRLTATQAALEIIKTGDRAAAEPGDTVVYRLAISNRGTAVARNLSITDRLPLGIRLINKSLTGTLNNTKIELNSSRANQTITITPNPSIELQPNQTLNIEYAAEITPDAIRGTGRNLAQAQASGLISNQASHILRIRPGIISDCGTLIGRVFIDKNFDGEQQTNEPGIPNAVIYMDDGNRIVTDSNGLYSLSNVIAGYRAATLDLTSLPGYALAPNKHFIEKNSLSRMVKLAPSSMVRINFGVTPAFAGEQR